MAGIMRTRIPKCTCTCGFREIIGAQGLGTIGVRSYRWLAGNVVMLKFINLEEMRKAIKENTELLEGWFDFIKPCEATDNHNKRLVWLKFEKVPIHAWNTKFFSSVGDLWGNLVMVDESTRTN